MAESIPPYSVQCIPCQAVSKWCRYTGHHASLSAMNTVSDMVPSTKRVRVSPLRAHPGGCSSDSDEPGRPCSPSAHSFEEVSPGTPGHRDVVRRFLSRI